MIVARRRMTATRAILQTVAILAKSGHLRRGCGDAEEIGGCFRAALAVDGVMSGDTVVFFGNLVN
jgi:hypothetical protein